MKTLYIILALFLFGAVSAHSQTLKTLSYNTTNGRVVYSGTNDLGFPETIKFGTNGAAVYTGGQFFFLTDGEGGVALQIGTNSITAYSKIAFGGTVSNTLANAAATRTNLGIASYTTPIAAHHSTALSPAIGGQTYYFGFPHDLAAVTTSTDRGFKFPYPGRIIAATATISITGTLGVGQSGSPSMGIQNKTSGAFSFFALPNLSWSNSLNTFARTNISIQVNTTDSYVFWVETPTFSTAPTSVRHYVTLFYRPD